MSLLAELRNKKKARATATPAIPATRKGESGGGIARIAGIAVATETNQENESANDVDFSAWPLPTLDDEQQPLAIAIPAIPATREPEPQPDKYQLALEALAACGWHGVTAENVARVISAGVTDEALLTAMLEVSHV